MKQRKSGKTNPYNNKTQQSVEFKSTVIYCLTAGAVDRANKKAELSQRRLPSIDF